MEKIKCPYNKDHSVLMSIIIENNKLKGRIFSSKFFKEKEEIVSKKQDKIFSIEDKEIKNKKENIYFYAYKGGNLILLERKIEDFLDNNLLLCKIDFKEYIPNIGICIKCNKVYKKCLNCGKLNKINATFCTACGRKYLKLDKYQISYNFSYLNEQISSYQIRKEKFFFKKEEELEEIIIDIPEGIDDKVLNKIKIYEFDDIFFLLFPWGEVLIYRYNDNKTILQILEGFNKEHINLEDDRTIYSPVKNIINLRKNKGTDLNNLIDIIFLCSKKRVYYLKPSLNNSRFEVLLKLKDNYRIIQSPLIGKKRLFLFLCDKNNKIGIYSIDWKEINFEKVSENEINEEKIKAIEDLKIQGFVSIPIKINQYSYLFYDKEKVYLVDVSKDNLEIKESFFHENKLIKEMRFTTNIKNNNKYIILKGKNNKLYEINYINGKVIELNINFERHSKIIYFDKKDYIVIVTQKNFILFNFILNELIKKTELEHKINLVTTTNNIVNEILIGIKEIRYYEEILKNKYSLVFLQDNNLENPLIEREIKTEIDEDREIIASGMVYNKIILVYKKENNILIEIYKIFI